MTKLIKEVGETSKILLVMSVACSMYSVAVHDGWKEEVAKQISWWSRAISSKKVGVDASAVFSPVGAILGNIVGSILGGLGFPSLAKWFYGTETSRPAVDVLLGPPLLEATHDRVRSHLKSGGQDFYIHRILVAHLLDTMSGDKVLETSVASQMVDCEASAEESAGNVRGFIHHCICD